MKIAMADKDAEIEPVPTHADPHIPVGWQGRRGDPSPYADF
jgi:hypothetical protein